MTNTDFNTSSGFNHRNLQNLVNVLWLIADRVNDIERVTNQIWELHK